MITPTRMGALAHSPVTILIGGDLYPRPTNESQTSCPIVETVHLISDYHYRKATNYWLGNR